MKEKRQKANTDGTIKQNTKENKMEKKAEKEFAEKDRRQSAFNTIGNLGWHLDAFLVWVKEMIETGDYSPKLDRKASRQEIGDFVRRWRCSIRVMQAILDAARHHEKLDSDITREGLIELSREGWSLWRSAEDLVDEISPEYENGTLDTSNHGALSYLSGVGFDTMTEAAIAIIRDFFETILPDTNPLATGTHQAEQGRN